MAKDTIPGSSTVRCRPREHIIDLMAHRFIITEYKISLLTSEFIGCDVCVIHQAVAIEVRQVV
jgi:hypothetical protein